MDAVFHITFYLDPGHIVQREAFYIDRLDGWWDEMEEHLAYCAEQLEKTYGQFNWVSGRSGAGIKNFGCDCFIDQSNSNNIHKQVMDEWRQIFHDAQPNCVLGPVCAVDVPSTGLSEVLKITYQAYEQQQTQQLRDTLNTHVGVVQSVAQRKKM